MKKANTNEKPKSPLSGQLCAVLLVPAILLMAGFGVYHVATASFVSVASTPKEAAQMAAPSMEASQGRMGALMKAAALNPNDATKQLEVAEALIQEGRLEIAEKFARKAMHADPKNPYAPYMLGYVRYMQNRPKEAVELMEQSLAIEDNPDMRMSAGSIALHLLQDKERAISHFKKGLAAPKLPEETRKALEGELKKAEGGQ